MSHLDNLTIQGTCTIAEMYVSGCSLRFIRSHVVTRQALFQASQIKIFSNSIFCLYCFQELSAVQLSRYHSSQTLWNRLKKQIRSVCNCLQVYLFQKSGLSYFRKSRLHTQTKYLSSSKKSPVQMPRISRRKSSSLHQILP